MDWRDNGSEPSHQMHHVFFESSEMQPSAVRVLSQLLGRPKVGWTERRG